MNIIKLNAIGSTNSYLIKLAKKKDLDDATIVVANNQKKGRGQMGLYWQSTPHLSLTFSVFKRYGNLPIQRLSAVAFAVSIAINNVLKKLSIPKTSIKWPNDIMSYSKKIAGILIESQVKQKKIISSVIGIGLNVNENNFKNLPQATSILIATGRKYDLDELLLMISEAILKELDNIENSDFQNLKSTYEDSLFRKDKVSVFEDKNGIRFNGIIKGVAKSGEIIIENDQELIKEYNLKEIKYLF